MSACLHCDAGWIELNSCLLKEAKKTHFIWVFVLLNNIVYSPFNNAPFNSGISPFNNDPKLTSKSTKERVNLKKKSMNVYEWPRRSLDLIPTEELWGDLRWDVNKKSSHNLTDLDCFSKKEWENVAKLRCATLIESYPNKRLSRVIKSKCASNINIFLIFSLKMFRFFPTSFVYFAIAH